MNRKFIRIACIFLIMIFFSCANTKKDALKKQSEDISNVGVAYMQQGDFSSALRELLRAAAIDPENSDVQNYIGLAYMAKEKTNLAIQHFQKALAIKPDYTAARNNLGTAYLAQKNWDMAITTFKKVNEDLLFITPHFPLSNLGWAYYNKQQYELAEKYYKEALDNQPRYIIAMRGLARTYVALNRISESISILDKALDIAPRFAPLYMELANAYTASNNYQQALETYKQIIALFANTPFADEAKKKVGEIVISQ